MNEFKSGKLRFDMKRVKERVAWALGVSISTVKSAMKNHDLEPHNQPRQKETPKILDDFDKNAIRNRVSVKL